MYVSSPCTSRVSPESKLFPQRTYYPSVTTNNVIFCCADVIQIACTRAELNRYFRKISPTAFVIGSSLIRPQSAYAAVSAANKNHAILQRV